MPNLRESIHWDKQLEDGLPDCRLSYSERDNDIVYLGRMPMHQVYCASCGKLQGLSTMHTTFVFYVCDPCVGRDGPPPACEEVKGPNLMEV